MHIVLNTKYKDLNSLYTEFGGENFKIDLGCGFVKPSGFIGLDNLCTVSVQIQNEDNAPDIVMDLNAHELPFPDNSCIEVRASHFLEHSNVMHILEQTHRILKPGGIFLFYVPYANSAEGMYPGHSTFFTEKWFYKNIIFQKLFKIIKEKYFESEDYQRLLPIVRKIIPFKYARIFLFNACWQMMMKCEAIK